MKPRQRSISVDDTLWRSLDKWLKTEDAKKRGFHSKSQFANLAIGELLLQHKDGILLNSTAIKVLLEEGSEIRNIAKQHMNFIAQLERYWFKNRLPNLES